MRLVRPAPAIAALLAVFAAASLPAATFNVTVGPGGAHTFLDADSGTSTTTIAAGDTVHWIWGSNFHSTTSGTCSAGTCTHNTSGEVWDSGLQNTPFTFDHVFSTPGNFPYFCIAHGPFGMTGTVVVESPATHYTVTAPANATTGVPFSVAVAALDAFNQTVTAYRGTVHFTSSDGSAVLPADYTYTAADAGSHTFSVTLATGGNQTITATDSSDGSITGSAGVAVEKTTVLKYHTIAPCRLVDTRRPAGTYGGPVLQGGGATRDFPAAGQCGIAADAMAIAVNVTVIIPPAIGDLRFFQTGIPAPGSSVINFGSGVTRANNAIIPLTGIPAGSFTVHCDMSGSTNAAIDVVGYFD
jgi:plastocyanin